MAHANSKWQDFPRRLLTVSIGAPTVFFLIYLGSPFYDFIVVAVGFLAGLELAHMISPGNRFWRIAIPLMLTLTILPTAYGQLTLALGINFSVLCVWAVQRKLSTGKINDRDQVAYFVIALLYVGLPLAMLLPARATVHGLCWTFALFVNNWTTDGFALIGGRFFGKTKLAPKISQAKTVEGATIGLLSSTLAGTVVLMTTIPSLSLTIAIGSNLAIAVLTIIGDLIESRIKRYFAVKDTGSFLPGHGGFLDRIDGLVLAIPIWYLIVIFSQSAV